MPIVIFRGVAFLVSLLGLALVVLLVVDDPGLLSVFAGKLMEGGLWTGLGLFVILAVVVGCWPRDAEGRLRGTSWRPR